MMSDGDGFIVSEEVYAVLSGLGAAPQGMNADFPSPGTDEALPAKDLGKALILIENLQDGLGGAAGCILFFAVMSFHQFHVEGILQQRDGCTQQFQQYGFQWAEAMPQMESNEGVRSQWQYLEATQHRRHRCYRKKI